MPSNIEILTQAYAAFNARDVDAVLALMQPDVDWPNGMEGGRVLGHANVRAYWLHQFTVVNPRVDPVGFHTDEQGRCVVNVHQVVRDLAGKILLDHAVFHAYSFRDGLIEHMEILNAD